jgi:alkanesulfonate monooxygenase SsuD/methylene tetrahydromethanopterin reductase-like flavin-dependent oxidoreductase (luciferase family)
MEVALVNLGDNLPHPLTGATHSDAEKHLSLLDQADAAEALGFDAFLLGEHHFNYYTISSPVTILAAIAQRTTNLRLGTAVTLLPTRDPVFVAEEIVTLDVLSGGRAEVAVGRGIHQQIYDVMGRPPEAATEILDEGLELLQMLLSGQPVTWSGQWRPPLEAVTIRPNSIQNPVPLWSGSTSAPALCARLGVPCIWVATVYPYQKLLPVADRFRQEWEQAGRGLSDLELGIGVHCHVAPTSQQARDRFRPYFGHYFECSASIEKSGLKRAVAPDARDMSLFDSVPFCGSPQELVDRICTARDWLGLTRIALVIDLGGIAHSEVMEQIELLGREVLPAVSI